MFSKKTHVETSDKNGLDSITLISFLNMEKHAESLLIDYYM